MRLRAHPLEIEDVILLKPLAFRDRRGLLLEIHRASAWVELGLSAPFVQANFSHSVCDVLRGLHYQHPPASQGKLVHVVRGEIFDVAVDLRKGSPTYGKWVGRVLSNRKPESLYVPPGFAHGFCTLAEEADVLYLTTSEYSPTHEAGILWNDPDLDIAWPIRDPVLSQRDANLPVLRQADIRFVYQPSDRPHAPAKAREE